LADAQVLFTLTGASEDGGARRGSRRDRAWLRGIGVEDVERDARLLAATIGEAGTEGAIETCCSRLALHARGGGPSHAARRRVRDLHWSSDSLLDLAEFVMQPRATLLS